MTFKKESLNVIILLNMIKSLFFIGIEKIDISFRLNGYFESLI